MSKGVFIEGITVEMLRNASLEAVETLLNEGDMVDMDVTPSEWIPVGERLPSDEGYYLVCMSWEHNNMDVLTWADGWNCYRDYDGKIRKESEIDGANILAWMPLPDPYKGGDDE